MKKPDELRVRIEDSTRSLEQDYERTLRSVEKLKENMFRLEQRIGQEKPEEAGEARRSLEAAVESLDRVTDSQILKSKEAWKTYEEMKHECEIKSAEPAQLDGFRASCKKTEQLAADLLCYSLGLPRHKNP